MYLNTHFRLSDFMPYLEPANRDFAAKNNFCMKTIMRNKVANEVPEALWALYDWRVIHKFLPLSFLQVAYTRSLRRKVANRLEWFIQENPDKVADYDACRYMSYSKVMTLLEQGLDQSREQLNVNMRSWELENSALVAAHWYYPQLKQLIRILYTTHIDQAEPRVIHWYECNPTTERYGDSKRHSARWTKFLGMLRHKYGMRFTDQQIEEVSNWVGENLRLPEYKFEEVSGTKIRKTYRESYFGSCMHSGDATKFYNDQENVRLLRILNEKDALVGRALIWEAHRNSKHGEKVTILDRIYPSDGGAHVRAGMKYASDKGWVYKVEHTIDGALSDDNDYYVHVKDNEYYPYMDTFGYVVTSPDEDGYYILTNNSSEALFGEMRSTDNVSPFEDDENYFRCANCNTREHLDYAFSTPDGELTCESCYSELYVTDVFEETIATEDAVSLSNVMYGYGHPDDYRIAYSEPDGVYYLIPEYRPRWTTMTVEIVQLTAGEYDGEWVDIDNAVCRGDDWYHVDDEDIPEEDEED